MQTNISVKRGFEADLGTNYYIIQESSKQLTNLSWNEFYSKLGFFHKLNRRGRA